MTAPRAEVPGIVTVIGGGAIGSGWAALFAAHGALVRLVDPDPDAPRRAKAALDCARSLASHAALPGRIEPSADTETALAQAEWVQESLPESLSLKRDVFARLADHLGHHAIVASSTSSFTPGELAHDLPFAERFLVVHPLHPVYAVPVVELCAGPRTSGHTTERAASVMRALAREPVLVRGEMPGLVANRLTAALLREAFDLVARDIVSPADLDRVVARGIGLGWTTAGPLGTEAMGSGSAGTFVDRYAEPLTRLWESLAAWPALDDDRRSALVRALASGPATNAGEASDAQCAWAKAIVRLLDAAVRAR